MPPPSFASAYAAVMRIDRWPKTSVCLVRVSWIETVSAANGARVLCVSCLSAWGWLVSPTCGGGGGVIALCWYAVLRIACHSAKDRRRPGSEILYVLHARKATLTGLCHDATRALLL